MTIIDTQSANSAGEPALEYKLYTTPYPIRVSPEGAEEGGGPSKPDPELAQLVFVASNNTRNPVKLNKLSVTIPTGTRAAELALSLERVESTISLQGWTSSRTDNRIEFTTIDPYAEIPSGQGLTFQISNIPVNDQVGAVELRIREEYPEEGDGEPDPGLLSIFTGKFPQDFYLDDFTANTYEVDYKGEVKLTWKRSEGVTTTLLYGSNDPEDVTPWEHKTVTDLKTTTMFYLIGKVGDVQIMRTLLVTVLKPDMVVTNLTVEGRFKAMDRATVYKEFRVTQGADREEDRMIWARPEKVDVHSDLRVMPSADRPEQGNLEVEGDAKVKGTLGAQGRATLSDGATVHKELLVTAQFLNKQEPVFWVDESDAQLHVETKVLKSVFNNSGRFSVDGHELP